MSKLWESYVIKDISFLYLSTSFSLGLIYKLILCVFFRYILLMGRNNQVKGKNTGRYFKFFCCVCLCIIAYPCWIHRLSLKDQRPTSIPWCMFVPTNVYGLMGLNAGKMPPCQWLRFSHIEASLGGNVWSEDNWEGPRRIQPQRLPGPMLREEVSETMSHTWQLKLMLRGHLCF